MAARGLTVFISDIRNCSNTKDEEKRVQLELANIRGKFTSGKALDSYNKKKYIWKLVYIYMLGYDIDFGHMEVINLVSGTKYSEKQVGYLATSVLMRNTDEMMTLIVNTIRTDLKSENEYFQSLALCAVANLGGRELTDALVSDVQRVLIAPRTKPAVRKKASLCLLRLYRTDPDVIVPEEWAPHVISLLEDNNIGVVTSVMGLLLTLVARQGSSGYMAAVKPAIQLLNRLIVQRAVSPEYMYYHVPSPWLQIKLLRLLQFFDKPTSTDLAGQLDSILNRITAHSEPKKSVNKNNAEHSVLFEAVNLIIHYGDQCDEALHNKAIKLLGRFISVRDGNIRYLGLASMSRLAHMYQREGMDTTAMMAEAHQSTILYSLKDADISIRKRALDLLFAMCNKQNAISIVQELLKHLAVADFLIKEEMVLKIAILAERYATDQRWYLDTILQLITIAGDYVTDDIWHRVVQIVTNKEDLQRYASEAMYRALQPNHVHETAVKVAAYVLGEFGYLLTEPDEAGNDANLITSQQLFEAVHKHFRNASPMTRRIQLHAYVKMLNLYEELTDQVNEVMDLYKDSLDCELQQRACEYSALPKLDTEKMQYILEPMPPFKDTSDSTSLDKHLQQLKSESTTVAWEQNRQSDSRSNDDTDSAEESDSSSDDDDGDGAQQRGTVDLLGLTESEPAPAPPPISAHATVVNDDHHGGGDATAATGPVVGIDPALIRQMTQWFLTCLKTPKGLLYEDSVIQVGVQHQYQTSQGKLLMFVGNKTTSAWTNFRLVVPPMGNVFRLQQSPVPDTIAANSQLKQTLMVECMVPFTSPPEFQVSFIGAGGQPHQYQLRLPIAATSFMQPVTMAADLFGPRWASLDDDTKKQQVTFELPSFTETQWPVVLQNLRTMLTSIHFAMIDGVPPGNPFALYGASTMCTGTVNAQTNKKTSVGCLLQLEVSPQAPSCKIDVRAVHTQVAVGTKQAVQQLVLQCVAALAAQS